MLRKLLSALSHMLRIDKKDMEETDERKFIDRFKVATKISLSKAELRYSLKVLTETFSNPLVN